MVTTTLRNPSVKKAIDDWKAPDSNKTALADAISKAFKTKEDTLTTIARPVAGKEPIKVTSNNATELADAFGDLKRKIEGLQVVEEEYKKAFLAYGEKIVEKKPTTTVVDIVGVTYKVQLHMKVEVDRFESKRFKEENPGITAYYTVPAIQRRVNVTNVKSVAV